MKTQPQNNKQNVETLKTNKKKKKKIIYTYIL